MQRQPTKQYWRAYGALYGEQLDLPTTTLQTTSRKRRLDVPTEAQEQIIAASWLTKMNILFYHVPNGGHRNPLEAAKFKRMGVRAGVPDICIPIPRKGHHGLYIELKRVYGGSFSEHQKYWLAELRRQGYDCYEAKGATDLINYVKNYLGAT